jgi:hypothetical protein
VRDKRGYAALRRDGASRAALWPRGPARTDAPAQGLVVAVSGPPSPLFDFPASPGTCQGRFASLRDGPATLDRTQARVAGRWQLSGKGQLRSDPETKRVFHSLQTRQYRRKAQELGTMEAAVKWIRGSRTVGLIAVSVAVTAGCSTSTAATTIASGLHQESHKAGILTYSIEWRIEDGRVQLDGLRAAFTTCHRKWIFFSTCDRGLVNPQVSFVIYAPNNERLWSQNAPVTRQPANMTLTRQLKRVTASAITWLPKDGDWRRMFPRGSYLRVELFGFDDWNSVEEGGDQFYQVAGARSSTLLG